MEKVTASLVLDEEQIEWLLRAALRVKAADEADSIRAEKSEIPTAVTSLLYEAQAQANDAWHDAQAEPAAERTSRLPRRLPHCTE